METYFRFFLNWNNFTSSLIFQFCIQTNIFRIISNEAMETNVMSINGECVGKREPMWLIGTSYSFIKKNEILKGSNLLLLMMQVSLIYNSTKSKERIFFDVDCKNCENHDTKILPSHCILKVFQLLLFRNNLRWKSPALTFKVVSFSEVSYCLQAFNLT